ncbi:hypothetical protein BB561_004122 [Smittium simulii]|uniref:phenylalanine--tRNA ligase n=1 Tax=Smittium simulii TaxID=133385 RepID=A0A2T9YHW7_9FUNG|nr:hypothetical protein BB561_004122 [Smittium simulii]
MPTVSIDKLDLYSYLKKDFKKSLKTFALNLELSLKMMQVTSDQIEQTFGSLSLNEKSEPERAQLKIDIPANRYDLLCFEGISRALAIYLQQQESPVYKLTTPDRMEQLTVKPSTTQIRPVAVAAILRNITFDSKIYKSFIDLQDKLHANLGRKRNLVSIGTHDLDTIKGPFEYSARKPTDIKFVPLNKDKSYDAVELMQLYESDLHLKKFLHIIKDSPVYPLMTDADDTVLSMPPIINGDHTKITLDTKNVFIEITAKDYTKAHIVLNTMITMFSGYCADPFTVEPVLVVNPDGTSEITPKLDCKVFECDTVYINKLIGVDLTSDQIVNYLKLMSLDGHLGKHKDAPPQDATTNIGAEIVQGELISVVVPPTRADILHQVDIIEDIAIAFGYNNIPRGSIGLPTVAKPTPVSKLTNLLRRELAFASWTEVLSLSLCSHDESFKFLMREDSGNEAVVLANPKTIEYQVCRSLLLPGILKTIRENKNHALPFKLFEVSDVILKDVNVKPRLCRNERHMSAIYSNHSAQFEVISGLLDRCMKMMDVPLIFGDDRTLVSGHGYWLEPSPDLKTFLPGRGANVLYKPVGSSLPVSIGFIGVLHPQVLSSFSLDYPCSIVEINIEPFI